ncbi:MAG TPA: type II/IV secretion system protein, partial [Albitalea sp.]|nr:type II/IV secretion system protein [Albitalea sp.]
MNPSDLPVHSTPTGKLELRWLIRWLREDHLITTEDAERIKKRFGSADSKQHPLVRLGAAGLTRRGSAKPLDTEALTEWLASRCGLPYLHIDPLKVDVGRVSDVMSISYAERRHALPLTVGTHEVTIATCEPFDTGWVSEIEAHTRRAIKLVLVSPLELQRYTTEFYTLSKSVRAAIKTGETSTLASFEQLVELGRSTKQLDANDQGVVQVVDWLWQY